MTPPAEEDPLVGTGSGVTTAVEVTAAVAAAPGVFRLSGGRLGGVRTCLPGRWVTGVVLREEDMEVHVIGRHGTPVWAKSLLKYARRLSRSQAAVPST